jgi:hypothetical protein
LTHDRTYTARKHDNNPETFIHTWLQNTLAPDPSQPPLNAPSPVISSPPDSRSPHELDRVQEGAIRRSLYAPILPAIPFDLFADNDSGINVPELFQDSPLDLHFDLERSSNVATLEVVSAIRQNLGSPSIPDDFEYDPDIDGTSRDERILRQNTLDPWPYDRRPLYYSGDEHYTVPEPPLPASPEHEPRWFLGRKIKQTASKCLRRTASLLSKVSKPRTIPRMPNSMVPHPNWGSFKFRSADDDLDDDQDDGDVELWLARTVRRNNRMAREGFDTTSGVHRKMTIEEYETSGSWVFQRQWEEDREEMLRERDLREKNVAFACKPRRGGRDIGPFEQEPLRHENFTASPHHPPTMYESFTRQLYPHSLSSPSPYRDENLPHGGIGAFPTTVTRVADSSLRKTLGRQFRRIVAPPRRTVPATLSYLQQADPTQPFSPALSLGSFQTPSPFDQARGEREAYHGHIESSSTAPNPSLQRYPPPPSLSSTADSESETSYRSFSHYDGYSSESVVIEQGERYVFQIWSPSYE